MSDLFQTPAVVQTVRTLVDGGTKLDIVTQELAAEDLTKLFTLKGKLGWFTFKESEIEPEDLDVPDIPEEFHGQKTVSQRLRNVMFVYWESCTNQKIPFNTWRENAMEDIITTYKEKLP